MQRRQTGHWSQRQAVTATHDPENMEQMEDIGARFSIEELRTMGSINPERQEVLGIRSCVFTSTRGMFYRYGGVRRDRSYSVATRSEFINVFEEYKILMKQLYQIEDYVQDLGGEMAKTPSNMRVKNIIRRGFLRMELSDIKCLHEQELSLYNRLHKLLLSQIAFVHLHVTRKPLGSQSAHFGIRWDSDPWSFDNFQNQGRLLYAAICVSRMVFSDKIWCCRPDGIRSAFIVKGNHPQIQIIALIILDPQKANNDCIAYCKLGMEDMSDEEKVKRVNADMSMYIEVHYRCLGCYKYGCTKHFTSSEQINGLKGMWNRYLFKGFQLKSARKIVPRECLAGVLAKELLVSNAIGWVYRNDEARYPLLAIGEIHSSGVCLFANMLSRDLMQYLHPSLGQFHLAIFRPYTWIDTNKFYRFLTKTVISPMQRIKANWVATIPICRLENESRFGLRAVEHVHFLSPPPQGDGSQRIYGNVFCQPPLKPGTTLEPLHLDGWERWMSLSKVVSQRIPILNVDEKQECQGHMKAVFNVEDPISSEIIDCDLNLIQYLSVRKLTGENVQNCKHICKLREWTHLVYVKKQEKEEFCEVLSTLETALMKALTGHS